tara:strand:+ start:38 stop:1060 length:1023 start_codon:yes stop_codon:yes gene_type:complete
MSDILITGGLGFIGSHLTRNLLENHNVLLIDKVTYAADENTLKEFKSHANCSFFKEDISNIKKINSVVDDFRPNIVFHLAAESHVDKSIENSKDFINSNIVGTYSVLEASLNLFKKDKNHDFIFHHISTDEVYGDLMDRKSREDLSLKNLFSESSKYYPSSPYSASKAASDHLVFAWGRTYNLPFIISNCSNNYGPNQAKEKFIPNIISTALHGKEIPIYGDGSQIRDWIYVLDHVEALIKLAFSKNIGIFNIGGDNQIKNLDLCKIILQKLDLLNPKTKNYSYLDQISFVDDRPGHDVKYGVDNSKIKKIIDWSPSVNLEKGLDITIDWYLKKLLRGKY